MRFQKQDWGKNSRRLRWATIVSLIIIFGSIFPLVIYEPSKMFFELLYFLAIAFSLFWVAKTKSVNRNKAQQELLDTPIPTGAGTEKMILYFRAFNEDENKVYKPLTWGSYRFKQKEGFLEKTTLEDLLAPYLHEYIGHFVALGNPKDKLPTFGALKPYFSITEWQQKVIEYCNHASFVLVTEASSKGVQWELAHLRNSVPANKIVLLISPIPFSREELAWNNFKSLLINAGYSVQLDDPGPGAIITINDQWEVTRFRQNLNTVEAYAMAIVEAYQKVV